MSHKSDIDKQCRARSDVAKHVWSGSTVFAFNTEISIRHGYDRNYPDTCSIENGPFQGVKVELSSWRKWIYRCGVFPT